MHLRQPLFLFLLVIAVLLLFTAGAASAHPTGTHTMGAGAAANASPPIGILVAIPTALAHSGHQQLVSSTLTERATHVYITKTGTKYHRNGCRYLAHSKIRKTLKWAKAHGYKPCKVCKPPK